MEKKRNKTGLPDALKDGIESISGQSVDMVKVRYNSARPALLNAVAYTKGTGIHLAHEEWHVVEQK